MSDSDEEVVEATPLTGSGRPSKAYSAGRVCRETGCATILSIYNDGAHCTRHAPMWTPRIRGRKIA